jgi:hypothetical protein
LLFGLGAALTIALSAALYLSSASLAVRLPAVAASIFAGAVLILAIFAWTRPRVAYAHGHVRLYVAALPELVPLDVVEAFLLGVGPALLHGEQFSQTQSRNLVIKLADRAADWIKRPVDPRIASWCDGYVTLRGAWCEPLSSELVQRLNDRLVALQAQANATRGLA